MREKKFARWQLLLAIILTAVTVSVLTLYALFLRIGDNGISLLQAWDIIDSSFVGDLEREKTFDGALSGMVDSLDDRWSYSLSAEELQQQNERRDNAYSGIGITVTFGDERGLTVESVREDSPSYRAGLMAGDIITAVDGVPLSGEIRYGGTDLIDKEAGCEVFLSVLRTNGETVEYSLTVEKIAVDPVYFEMTKDKIGYIKLSNFFAGSADALIQAVEKAVREGAIALVFDMRDNGGGYLDEMTKMLDRLLPEGIILRTREKFGREKTVSSDERCINLPMAVLVNRNTYSAAEFFAAELKEKGGALIIGEETSGKGYSQQTFSLRNGAAIAVSTGTYKTGNGISLIGTGVTLDERAVLTREDKLAYDAGKLPISNDSVFRSAVRMLRDVLHTDD